MSQAPLHIIESHTGGEPTRVVVAGGPDLGRGSMAEKSKRLRDEYDWLRRSICEEPRGHEAMVGALICETEQPDCVCGVIFFNNQTNLGMCVHGTIGLAVTLAHLGKIGVGIHRLDTPAGVVTVTLSEDGAVEVANVPSFRTAAGVEVEVPGWGRIRGDVAWGGNWFFLIDQQGPAVDVSNIEELTQFTRLVRKALKDQGVTGDDGEEVDHIEVFGPAADSTRADSQNFVLCSSHSYDRSACGTGTSAKLACLFADGKLDEKKIWRQAGILGAVFKASATALPDGKILPVIAGRAWINGESVYHFHPSDPFRYGIS